jgi:hypothetical protein
MRRDDRLEGRPPTGHLHCSAAPGRLRAGNGLAPEAAPTLLSLRGETDPALNSGRCCPRLAVERGLVLRRER